MARWLEKTFLRRSLRIFSSGCLCVEVGVNLVLTYTIYHNSMSTTVLVLLFNLNELCEGVGKASHGRCFCMDVTQPI